MLFVANIFKRIVRSVWLFPAIIVLIVLLLAALKINGSSTGSYYSSLFGTENKDNSLLAGKPKAIRSDEWLVWSQVTQSQAQTGFQEVNPGMSSGQSVVLHTEIPSKHWSTIFKPQHWPFFLMPLENAFALKWWMMLALLVISCYFFVLRFLGSNRLVASILSLSMGLSPFIIWWYQTAVFAGISYSLLIMIVSVRLLKSEKWQPIKSPYHSDILSSIFLFYLIVCFGLTFYPPFQIPLVIVSTLFIVGKLLNMRRDNLVGSSQLARRLSLIIIPALLAGIVGFAYIKNNWSTLASLNDAVYPGSRIVSSGNANPITVLSGFVMPLLQSSSRSSNFYTNQSEASNFILLLPFLLVPSLLLSAYELKKRRKIDWVFNLMILCSLIFFARMYLPVDGLFYKLLLLNKVPHLRLVIGLGLLNFIVLVLFLNKIESLKISKNTLFKYAVPYAFFAFVVLGFAARYIEKKHPLFINGWHEASLLAFAFTAILFFTLINRRLLVGLALLFFTVLSCFKIMPIYRGLGLVMNGEIIQKMRLLSDKDTSWITVGDIKYENSGLLAGAKSVGGIQLYPKPDFWTRIYGDRYSDIFNRKAHVVFRVDKDQTENVVLLQPNLISVDFSCNSFVKENIDYILSTEVLRESCVSRIDTEKYPKATFYIYRVK